MRENKTQPRELACLSSTATRWRRCCWQPEIIWACACAVLIIRNLCWKCATQSRALLILQFEDPTTTYLDRAWDTNTCWWCLDKRQQIFQATSLATTIDQSRTGTTSRWMVMFSIDWSRSLPFFWGLLETTSLTRCTRLFDLWLAEAMKWDWVPAINELEMENEMSLLMEISCAQRRGNPLENRLA